MILLQASICWSAGVFSLVQSGPSWARDWANKGVDHSAAAASASMTIKRRINPLPCDSKFEGSSPRHHPRFKGVSLGGQTMVGQDIQRSAAHHLPIHEKRRDSEPDHGVLPPGRHGGID